MLALDKYLEAPDVKVRDDLYHDIWHQPNRPALQILEKVYTTINSMDLSALSPLVGIDMRMCGCSLQLWVQSISWCSNVVCSQSCDWPLKQVFCVQSGLG